MPDYSFRPVERDDLGMLADWLASPQVAAWWPDPAVQLALLTEDLDQPAMAQLIVLHGDTPIAYAQHYPCHEWAAPHFAHLPADCVAIDAFAATDGMGHGGAWLRRLGGKLLQQASLLAIDPDPRNLRAIRAYQKAGFAGDRISPNAQGWPCRILTRRR